MRQLLLSAILCIATFSINAQSNLRNSILRQKYNELSKVTYITDQTSRDSLPLISSYALDDVRMAMASGLDKQQIKECGDSVYNILSSIGLSKMINGGNNKLAMGFVYADELSPDRYELLLVAGSGNSGFIGVIYGTTDKETLTKIQRSELYLHDATIKLYLGRTKHGDNAYLINIGE